MEEEIFLTNKEIKALAKAYLSTSIYWEHLAFQNDETYNTLANLFERMGFDRHSFDLYHASDILFREDSIDSMIKMIKVMSYKERGSLLYSIIYWRYISDPMGGQFDDYFDTFLIYLLNSIFVKRTNHDIFNGIREIIFNI